MASVVVFGATGYLGGELLRLLADHPQLKVEHAISKSQAGRPVAEVMPNLAGLYEGLAFEADGASVDADLAFLAQPPGEAMNVVPRLLERGVRAIDLGPDYRLPDPAEYARVYKRPHADPEHLAEAVYGLPELFGERLGGARLVANPGCYPTATLLALAPLWERRQITGPVIVDAKSGTSGAGHELSATSHHPEAALTVWPYGTPEHRHLSEMRGALERIAPGAPGLVFVPHLVPLVRGILCSIYPTPAASADPAGWAALLAERYAGSPFVHVGPVPKLPWAQGTNRCYLSVQRSGDAPVLFSAIDNLGKGGAAQAIQNANLLFGWDEKAGLDRPGFGV
jgi:N-acetyl-gamma-glutamyl-phosphate reductase